jgi:hypothetical protein
MSNKDAAMIMPRRWFQSAYVTSNEWDRYGKLFDNRLSGFGWTLVRGVMSMKFEGDSNTASFTNSLHLILVPDVTRLRFMRDYPDARASDFYKLLVEAMGSSSPPDCLKDIIVTPLLRRVAYHDKAAFLSFQAHEEQMMSLPATTIAYPLKAQQRTDQAVHPTLRILAGDCTGPRILPTHQYSIVLHYDDFDFELVDSQVVHSWRKKAQPVHGCTREVDRTFMSSLLHDYAYVTSLSHSELFKKLCANIEQNTPIAELDGM